MTLSSSAPEPTGRSEDGLSYYTEEDIRTNKNRISLNLLPPGNTYLRVVPSAAANSSEQYYGNSTPIHCYVQDGKRFYRCRHEMIEADEEEGTPAVICTQVWEAKTSVTIGTVRTHCRSNGHWNKGKTKINLQAGQKQLSAFFTKGPKRQRSSPVPRNCAAVSSNNIPESAGDNGDDDIIEVDMGIGGEGDISFSEPSIEHVACVGLYFGDFPIEFDFNYDIIKDYPWSIHSEAVQQSYKDSNLIPKVSWRLTTDGFFKDLKCGQVISRDINNQVEMNNTSAPSGLPICRVCIQLKYNQHLLKVLKRSIFKTYGEQLPNALCPSSTVAARIAALKNKLDDQRLTRFNMDRKLLSISRRVNDNSRLMMLLQERDVPGFQRLLTVHLRNGGSMKSFIDKCIRASDYKLVGHSTYQRNLIQRGKMDSNGKYDAAAYKVLMLTILMSKLGCSKLIHTYSFAHGGLSKRQMQRHVNVLGTVPNFNLRLTSCLSSEQGLLSIERNMDDLFCNQDFLRFLPTDGKFVAGLFIDGVAIDEMLNLDDSQLPHQVTGLCRHCADTTYDAYADAQRIEDGLNDGTFHYAKEAEVFCIGINHPTFTGLIPICISPTCKKDDVVGESTHTVEAIISTITRKWHTYDISKQFIMSVYNSDGAPPFRKGVGGVLNKDLPPAIRAVYVGPGDVKRCPLLNLVGGSDGTTASCDTDHLAKRFRGRIRSAMGIMIKLCIFTKSDLANILQMAGVVTSPEEAHRLFNPDDLMDVLETVKCLHAVGKLASIAMSDFPSGWRSVPENHHKFREMRLLGLVSKMMCTAVVGHDGEIEEEGDHLSISGYLTNLSKLAHVLFILYRCNRTDFIPAQNYRNWQEMIKNIFISLTQAKVNGVEVFYWFLQSNKRIEEFFGILRSLRRGDLNFDAWDIRNRISDASIVQWIYAQHPEWNDQARHLKSSADRKNTKSWKGCVDPSKVDEVACWMNGRNDAIASLRASRLFEEAELDIDAIVEAEPGVDMFRPYQKRIGVHAGDRAEYSLIDLEDAADDEEPEEGSGGAVAEQA